MNTNELVLLLIRESFHSFEIGDRFTQHLLADIAYCKRLHNQVTIKEMKIKTSRFIQAQIKIGNITKVDGVKDGRYQVYEKVSPLLKYKTRTIEPIPPEYQDLYQFGMIWMMGETVTAEDFYNVLKENEVDVTYEGQSSKFLWIISDRCLADCKVHPKDTKKNLYIRIDSIPEHLLRQTTTKFMRIPDGEYQSRLNEI
jgi:hypothetical protein